MSSSTGISRTRPFLILWAIVFLATNLRAPVTGIAPLLVSIQHDLSLNSTTAGMLTAMPLFLFALVSLVCARLARYFGLERALALAAGLIVSGLLLRVQGSTSALFMGMGLLAVGIGAGNVLLPSAVKRYFPTRIAFVTSLYVLLMGVVAALNSVAVYPLLQWTGSWRWASLILLVVALPALVLWLDQWRRLRAHPLEPLAPSASALGDQAISVWKWPTAWHITLYMGFNSVCYYMLISWLPKLLLDTGFSESQAGQIHGWLQLMTAIPGLLMMPLMGRFKDLRGLAFVFAAIQSVAFAGFTLWPAWAVLWSSLFGIGSGSVFIIALSLIGMRSHSSQQAASLSGMAQFVAYLMAACGPPLLGALHDWTGGWVVGMVFCAAFSLAMVLAGLKAAKPQTGAS